MADKNTLSLPASRTRLTDWWSVGAILIASLVVLPIVVVVYLAFFPTENIWPHLWNTVLVRYVTNTIVLVAGVGLLAGSAGTGAAWLLAMYEFPGSRWLSWALLLPLAIPAYVGAYALVDFLEYAGPVQTALRDAFGWQTARDYWFPEIRSRGAAIVVLSAALFPYVYLLVRTALKEHSASAFDVARALGAGPIARFWRVGLPLARPAIAASVAIVMMETVSDYGVVSYFAVQTLTTGIFATWLDGGNAGGAAQISAVVLGAVFLMVALEKRGRLKMRYFQTSRQARPMSPTRLTGPTGWLAFVLCLIPFTVGFLLPGGVILTHAIDNTSEWVAPGLIRAFGNTLLTGGSAAVVTVIAALLMTFGIRLSGKALPHILLPLSTIGYAAPGAVLAVGLLLPMSTIDHALADGVEALTGYDIGLVMTGSAFAIIYAYAVRFFAIAQGTVDSALGRISPSLPMAARSLGRDELGSLRDVTLPLIRGSLATALLLVFVDCVKELPATLLLRPFNFNTLSTRVYEKASLEHLGEASPAAIIVILVGLCAVLLVARQHR